VSLQLAGARARGPDPRLEDDLDAPIVRPGLVRLRDWGGGDGRGKLRINLLSLDIKSLMYWSGGGVVGTQPAIKASGSGALPVGEGLARGWRGVGEGRRLGPCRSSDKPNENRGGDKRARRSRAHLPRISWLQRR
jgi:hypothetical protein